MASSCSPIRQNYRRHLAENMLKDIQTISSNNYFLTIGKITPWPTEDVGASLSGTNYARPVPVPTDSDSVETEFWQNVVAAKRVTSDNISLVIPRFDWKLGSVYQPYRDYTYLFDPDYPSQFYVLVDDTRVYKCIDNNYGATSTIAPTHTDPEIRKLADGYRWKFMYQISEDKRKFMTKTVYDETLQSDTPYRRVIIQGYMPVSYVEYLRMSDDDRVLQWNVQESAINGEISFVGIKEQYKPYLTVVNCLKPDNQNVIQEGYTAGHTGSVRLYSPYLIGLNGIYDNLILSIDDGPGEGQRRIINSYTYSATGNYGTVVLDSSLSVGLSAGNSKFSIVPNVQIEGDGFPRDTTLNHFKEADIGLKFGPALNTGSSGGCDTTNIYNQSYVDSYEIIDGGRDYTRAEFKAIKGLTFTAGLTGIGSLNDTAEIVFSPPGGHGSNAIRELGTAAIMVVVEFSQTEKNTMTVANDYRQFGILKNPLLKNKQVRLRLGAIGLSGSFTVGGSLTQGPTGGISGATYSEASGTVVYWRKGPTGTGLSGVDKYGVSELIVKNVTGNFASTGRVHSTVSGSDSGWFDVVDVSERTVAGTEGRELLRLKVIPTTIYDPQTGGSAAAFQPGGEDFHPGMYIASIGNLESNIHNTHFTGSIFRWEPTIGTNTNATLYIEEPSGLPSRFEKLVEVDYYLRPSIPSRYGLTGATAGRPVNNTGTAIVVEIGDIIRDSPSLYDQTTSLRLSTSLSNPFGTNSFRQDSLIKSYAGLTAEASGLVLDWIAVDGATSGTLRLCGVQGQFAASSLISFRDNKGETAQTQIHSILHEDELKYRSGELTYIQNTQPITRSLEQREEIKVLFQF
jgi:hypothetical protein